MSAKTATEYEEIITSYKNALHEAKANAQHYYASICEIDGEADGLMIKAEALEENNIKLRGALRDVLAIWQECPTEMRQTIEALLAQPPAKIVHPFNGGITNITAYPNSYAHGVEKIPGARVFVLEWIRPS